MRYLEDISCKLHTDDEGFDLTVRFEANDSFSNTVLTKSYIIPNENVIEKIIGTEI